MNWSMNNKLLAARCPRLVEWPAFIRAPFLAPMPIPR
jgi:hypothetical protein